MSKPITALPYERAASELLGSLPVYQIDPCLLEPALDANAPAGQTLMRLTCELLLVSGRSKSESESLPAVEL